MTVVRMAWSVGDGLIAEITGPEAFGDFSGTFSTISEGFRAGFRGAGEPHNP